VEGGRTAPFEIARVFYLYDVVAGAERGGHAHREQHQLIACVMGGCAVALFDGKNRRRVTLDRAYRALHVPSMIWAEVIDFTSGAVCVVLTSQRFTEADYVRDHDEYLRLRGTADEPPARDNS
jgi:dTDP-4-dehydrorhamnose 3,5-epimerase-like enzyme